MQILHRLRDGLALTLALVILAIPARAQPTSDPDSYVFLVVVAERGIHCGLLESWQTTAILSEARRAIASLGDDERANLAATALQQAASTPCDDPQVNTWISGAAPGIEREWLPPHLALFRSFAAMDNPPDLFLSIVASTDLSLAVSAIDGEIIAFQANGILPEGNQTWEAYLGQVNAVAAEIAAAARGEPSTAFTQASARAYVLDAALITTLWLAQRN